MFHVYFVPLFLCPLVEQGAIFHACVSILNLYLLHSISFFSSAAQFLRSFHSAICPLTLCSQALQCIPQCVSGSAHGLPAPPSDGRVGAPSSQPTTGSTEGNLSSCVSWDCVRISPHPTPRPPAEALISRVFYFLDWFQQRI